MPDLTQPRAEQVSVPFEAVLTATSEAAASTIAGLTRDLGLARATIDALSARITELETTATQGA